VFFETEALARRLETNEVSMEAWHRSRAIYESPEGQTDLDLGFATFFLNRCNRSGILTARPIGGLDQTGRWKIDARFNRESLAHRVRFLGGYRRRVTVTQQDARDFLRDIEHLQQDVLVYVDPPFLLQGDGLYLDCLSIEDHTELSRLLQDSRMPWFLTYDVHERITSDLYDGLRTVEFDIAHTAQVQHVGSEYAVFSESLALPSIDLIRRGDARWIA
jgi:DNA adenine methylase